MNTKENRYENKIITIPNLLSMVRLLLIPVIVWLYVVKKEYVWAAVVLVVSGLTDTIDGFIARKFNMISNLGKILDPVADKLTQGIVIICLVSRFPFMGIALILFVIKEIINALSHLIMMKKSGKVFGADWHGKVVTILLYVVMFLHVVWGNISPIISNVSIWICIIMMVISAILYLKQMITCINQ